MPLDVTTWTDPVSPDCARSIGTLSVPGGRVFECQSLVPANETACVMPYSVFARGTAADGATAEARIDSLATLTQPAGCSAAGGESGKIPIPATDTVQLSGSLGRGWVDAVALLVVVLAAMALTIGRQAGTRDAR